MPTKCTLGFHHLPSAGKRSEEPLRAKYDVQMPWEGIVAKAGLLEKETSEEGKTKLPIS